MNRNTSLHDICSFYCSRFSFKDKFTRFFKYFFI